MAVQTGDGERREEGYLDSDGTVEVSAPVADEEHVRRDCARSGRWNEWCSGNQSGSGGLGRRERRKTGADSGVEVEDDDGGRKTWRSVLAGKR
jgi:hypothetical protein